MSITARIAELTPDIASSLLKNNIERNRPVSRRVVETYKSDISSGRWCNDAVACIVVSNTGKLMDGQHRCYAVSESGIPINVIFVENVPEKAFEALDNGLKRTASQFLDMHVSNTLAASLSKAFVAIERYGISMDTALRSTTSITRQEIIDYANENIEELRICADGASKINKAIGKGSPTAYGIALHCASILEGRQTVLEIVSEIKSQRTKTSSLFIQAILKKYMNDDVVTPQWVLGTSLQYVDSFLHRKETARFNKQAEYIDLYNKLIRRAINGNK